MSQANEKTQSNEQVWTEDEFIKRYLPKTHEKMREQQQSESLGHRLAQRAIEQVKQRLQSAGQPR